MGFLAFFGGLCQYLSKAFHTQEVQFMATVMYGHSSFAQCEMEDLTLCLSARLFPAELWLAIKVWFQTDKCDSHWLSAPMRLMTTEEKIPGYPRWKQIGIDSLSWILFHLLVPATHPLVQLWQVIDWQAINRLCAPVYRNSRYGQRAWAPAQLFALLLLFFVLPVSSECGLLRLVAIVPLYRWFCGFGLFTQLPDHSTLHTFRKNVGAERFEAILSLVVMLCLERKLIANNLVHFDMMGVPASARPWAPHERAVLLTLGLVRYLEQARKGNESLESLPDALRQLTAEVAVEVLGNKRLKKDPQAPGRVWRSVKRWTQERQEANGQALWEMNLEEGVQTLLAEEETMRDMALRAQNPQRDWLKKLAQRLKAQLTHACGDMDARVGKVNDTLLQCGYWLGFLVDNLHSVITAVRVVPLNIAQRSEMLPALDRHQTTIGTYPQAVAADSAQDFYAVHEGLDQREIQGHIASRDRPSGGSGLNTAYFTWDEANQLRCPEGKMLSAGKLGYEGRTPFRAQASDCRVCGRKEECLPKGQQPDGPRFIRLRVVSHRRWHQNREHTRTEDYKKAQKRRFASEGLFGLAERLFRADKMPYRSEPMNHVAGLLIGTAMNLTLLARHGATA